MDQRTRITKTMLAKSLIEMVKEQNINSISIRELCQRADINRSTFYRYYGNQFDLLHEIEDWFISNIQEKLTNSIDKNDNLNIITSVLTVLNENVELARMFYFTNPNFNFFAKMTDNLQIRDKLQLKPSNIPENMHDYVHSFYKIGAHRIICRWLNQEDRTNIEEVAKLIVELHKRTYENYE